MAPASLHHDDTPETLGDMGFPTEHRPYPHWTDGFCCFSEGRTESFAFPSSMIPACGSSGITITAKTYMQQLTQRPKTLIQRPIDADCATTAGYSGSRQIWLVTLHHPTHIRYTCTFATSRPPTEFLDVAFEWYRHLHSLVRGHRGTWQGGDCAQVALCKCT